MEEELEAIAMYLRHIGNELGKINDILSKIEAHFSYYEREEKKKEKED